MQLRQSKILDKLLLLLLVFTTGLIALVLVHVFFMNLEKKLDSRTDNLVAKVTIGEFISEDLLIIRSDFYELSTAVTNQKGRKLIVKKINKTIKNIENMLDVLENGGKVSRLINLNIAGNNSTVKEIEYIKANKNRVSLEVIDLRPKLKQIAQMTKKVEELLFLSDKLLKTDPMAYARSTKSIKRFYKSTPAFFIRISENNRRLLFEGENELKKLQDQVNEQKANYLNLEILTVVTTIILVFILGYFISKQIRRISEELNDQRLANRSILDAQPNIVIVTDGYQMRDVNAALFEYLTRFKNFEDFKKEYDCICDFFLEPDLEDSDDYITKKVYDGVVWAEYAYIRPHKIFKVCMKLKGNEYSHFVLNVKKKELSNNEVIMVISFNDITDEIHNQRKLKELNDNLEHMVDKKTSELQDLNDNLEQKIEIELDKNRKKDQQMIQQSRFAALGEMIGNIAHQWRQPLSAISSSASGMQLQIQLGLASNKDIETSFKDIMNYVNFLTQTIEDFRGFFTKDKEIKEFDVNEVLSKTLKITSSTYKDHGVDIVRENENQKFIIKGFPSELTQVFLNILTNAKDVLIEHKIENKIVFIKVQELNNKIEIIFHDNAGGVPISIIDKIFDPYFTTKHQSQGTGIGLFMSKDIIEKHMAGNISVNNKILELDGNDYKGACFKIELPKV